MMSEIERKFIGKSIPRIEDPLLVTGKATFADDVKIPGMLYGAILRSPYAHTRIRRIDFLRVLEQSGVLAAVTGEEARDRTQKMFGMPPGFTDYCLSFDKVRYVGEPVAAVAAQTRGAAEDALEHFDIDYEPLAPVVDARKALEPNSSSVFDEREDNICYRRIWDYGDIDKAFDLADTVVKSNFRWNRTAANPIETFSVTATYDPTGTLTVWSNLQGHAALAGAIAAILKLPSTKL